MEEETVTVLFHVPEQNIEADIEIPLYISPNDLLFALNEAYHLQIPQEELNRKHLKSERPTALLEGAGTLEEFGIRNGTEIYFMG